VSPSLVATATVDVAADRGRVFRLLTEPELVPLWVKGLVESRPEGDGQVRLGARSVEVVHEGGRTMQMTAEIVELIPDSIVANRLEAADGQYLSRFELRDVGPACRVAQSMTAEIGLPRLVPRRFVTWMLSARLRRDLGRLKRLAESERLI
jgi:uncharacterized protein YndB with AHSA1/START domain